MQRISPRIQTLSPTVANQIAAGEVIERPASVVKELLENALDSGAQAVHVDIHMGGFNYIKVSDNGHGIIAEDLPLAIAAHATSKISKLSDLGALKSLGFRGEALASIASVAKITICSKPLASQEAMLLEKIDESINLTRAVRSQGTTIEVRDLFYNAPVRKKFLKSVRMEFLAIEAVVRRLALCSPEIAFSLKHNDKNILLLQPALCEQTQLARIRQLMGKAFVDAAVAIDTLRAGMHLHGFLAQSSYMRSQNDKQWIYVNQRMIKDKLIQHAIKQAYEHVLYPGRYPACLLYLSLPADEVDVNVHPTKHEVRFQQPRLVHDFIVHALKNQLGSKAETPLLMPVPEVKRPLGHHATGSAYEVLRAEQNYLILSGRHILYQQHGKYYLVDAQAIYHQSLFAKLWPMPKPLPSRPVLVPIAIAAAKVAAPILTMLNQLGVELQLRPDGAYQVVRIPMMLQALDIQLLLRTIQDFQPSKVTDQDLLQAMVAALRFDLRYLAEDDKSWLQACITTLPLQEENNHCWITLNESACQRLFDE